jgi:hypothetical protein
MKAHRTKKYAILTRMPSPHYGHVITMIAANHGRAAQGVVEFLVNQVKLQTLFERMQIQPNNPLPSSFQIVFQVSVSKLNGEGAPETVTPVEWRIDAIPTHVEEQPSQRFHIKLRSQSPVS